MGGGGKEQASAAPGLQEEPRSVGLRWLPGEGPQEAKTGEWEKWIVRRKPGTSGNLRARKIRRNE